MCDVLKYFIVDRLQVQSVKAMQSNTTQKDAKHTVETEVKERSVKLSPRQWTDRGETPTAAYAAKGKDKPG